MLFYGIQSKIKNIWEILPSYLNSIFTFDNFIINEILYSDSERLILGKISLSFIWLFDYIQEGSAKLRSIIITNVQVIYI
jgi:hypothetical protein